MLEYKITKALIAKARRAALAYLEKKESLSSRKRAALLGGVTMAAQRLFEVREESRGVLSFSSYESYQALFLGGAKDMYQCANAGGALFLSNADILELFCTEKDAARFEQWASGEGGADFPLLNPAFFKSLATFYAHWVGEGAKALYTALKIEQGYTPRSR